MNVLIVESPSKAKSINKYLGSGFKVLASVGHVRDLSAKNDAIDTENDFQMQWETSDRGKKVIKEITDAAKKSENLYLATDPPFKSEFRFFEKLGIFTFELVLSLWSWPAISSSNIDASVTFFEKTPAWSKLDAKAAIPHLEHKP